MAISLAHKVRVNSVSPGWIDTGAYYDENYAPQYSEEDEKQHPSGRVGEPMDIARIVMFLCNEETALLTGKTLL